MDKEIDTALNSEPARRAPAGFFGRMRKRLALVAMIQQEQRHFRKYAAAAGGFLLAAVAGVALAYVASIPSRIAWYVPGGMGFMDYVKTQLSLSVRMLAVFLALGIAVPIVTALVTFLRPSDKSDKKQRDTVFW